MNDFFFIKEYVDRILNAGDKIDHGKIADDFVYDIHNAMDNARFENLLIVSGFIPDLYPINSGKEKLFAKLIEGIVKEWAARIGASGELIKQKSSYEDIKVTIANRVIVCDAKSNRLGRSQPAPNPKDFLKLGDIRKWMDRYPKAIGGLITYPCKHEWSETSDIYQYSTTKETPSIILPYKYLAYLLHHKDSYPLRELLALWNYEALFPHKLVKDMIGGNKIAYWNVINTIIMQITKTGIDQFTSYMDIANGLINDCVAENLILIKKHRQEIIDKIESRENKELDIKSMRKRFIEYQIVKETEEIDKMIKRIASFR